jgi:hypothetical protein
VLKRNCPRAGLPEAVPTNTKGRPWDRKTAEPQLQLNLLLEVYRATGQSIIAVPPRLVIAVVVVSIASGTVIPIAIVPVTPRLVVLIMVIAVSRSVFLVVTRHTGPATATMAVYGKATDNYRQTLCSQSFPAVNGFEKLRAEVR